MGSFFLLPRCFFFFFFFFFLEGGAFAASRKIWSRTEMVEMAGYGEQKLSSVIITGSLLCDTTSRPPLAIPGATVAIKCHSRGSKRGSSKWIKAVTDDLGEFEIDLPSQLHAIPNLENTCFIKPLQVPKLYRCYHTSTNLHKRIKLVSSTNGFRLYTSGKIKLQGTVQDRRKKVVSTLQQKI